MKKILTTGILTLLSLALVGCSNKSSQPTHSKIEKVNSTIEAAKPELTSLKITKSEYNQIKIGDEYSGKGGTTQSYTFKLLGKPIYKTNVTLPNSHKTAAVYTWPGEKANFKTSKISIEILNKKVISKSYAAKANGKITDKSKIDSLKIGSTYNYALQSLGKPNGESVYKTSKFDVSAITYLRDKKGNAINLTFVNNKLENKGNTKVQ